MKKLSFMLVTALLMCTLFTACSNSNTGESASTTPSPKPGHVSSLPEGSVTIDINSLCAGAGEANELGWIPANIYMDTVQKQYDASQDENLKLVLSNSKNAIATAHIFLGMKFSEDTVTYAYEATESSTDNILVMYVEVASSGSSHITTGPVSDIDQILLGVTENETSTEETTVSTETSTETEVTTESETSTEVESTEESSVTDESKETPESKNVIDKTEAAGNN